MISSLSVKQNRVTADSNWTRIRHLKNYETQLTVPSMIIQPNVLLNDLSVNCNDRKHERQSLSN